tara:strand:- start:1314 stop:2183 length:870 start_codon:yes stop_codon:yes gene_type:complete
MKILITGASGMLGASIAKQWIDKYNIYGTARSNFDGNILDKFFIFDLSSDSYRKLFDWVKPDIIIHCGAITDLELCEIDPENAMKVNGLSVKKLYKYSRNSKIIFISSDAVFNDKNTPSFETDITKPLNFYGKSKLLGESELLKTNSESVVIRTTIVGRNINPNKKSFVEWLIDSLVNNKKINLFEDVFFTPITIWDLINEIEWIMNNSISGVFHIACTQPISKYEFGLKICEKLNLDVSLINKISLESMRFNAKRLKNQSLDVSHYRKIAKRKLPTIDMTVKSIIANF